MPILTEQQVAEMLANATLRGLDGDFAQKDRQFLVAARRDVPLLCETVEALRADNKILDEEGQRSAEAIHGLVADNEQLKAIIDTMRTTDDGKPITFGSRVFIVCDGHAGWVDSGCWQDPGIYEATLYQAMEGQPYLLAIGEEEAAWWDGPIYSTWTAAKEKDHAS